VPLNRGELAPDLLELALGLPSGFLEFLLGLLEFGILGDQGVEQSLELLLVWKADSRLDAARADARASRPILEIPSNARIGLNLGDELFGVHGILQVWC